MKPKLPDLSRLSTDEMFDLLPHADEFIQFGKAVQDYCYQRMLDGEKRADWKFVAGRGTRVYKDENAVRDWLTTSVGLDREDYMVEKLATPAQVEKLLTKEERKALGEFVITRPSAPKLVPSTDPRPGIHPDTREMFPDD